MDTKKERERLERLGKLLDMYEQGERRIESNVQSVGIFAKMERDFGGLVNLIDRYKKRVDDTQAAMRRIEIAYKLTLNKSHNGRSSEVRC